MKEDCEHQAFKSLTFFVNKFNWYSTREAMDYYEQKNMESKNESLKTKFKMKVYYRLPMGIRAWIFYIYRYYFRLGFLDGKEEFMHFCMHIGIGIWLMQRYMNMRS